jgi:hypothetical protein
MVVIYVIDADYSSVRPTARSVDDAVPLPGERIGS